MKSQSSKNDFKTVILNRLEERDKRETRGYAELFQHHERLFENWAAIKAENLRLSLQVERGHYGDFKSGLSEEKEKAFDQLLEEVREYRKKREESAEQVLTFSAKLSEKEAELEKTQTQLVESVAKASDLEDRVKILQSQLQELEATNELLRDEHQALQLAYGSLEENYRKTTSENQELVQRYMLIKAQHADLMNQENENFIKKKQAKVQEELEEAAAEMKNVNISPHKQSTLPIVPSDEMSCAASNAYCSVPTSPSIKFVRENK